MTSAWPPHSSWTAAASDEPGGVAFARLADAVRALQDAFTAARPPEGVLDDVAGTVEVLTRRLADHAVDEASQVTGHRHDLPGRGQTMAPAVHVDERSRDRVRGRVTFGRFYLGGGGAVHGGAIPLLFDEVLGRLANTDRPRSRTAYLHVDYRAVTPVGEELVVAGWFDREEGRKRFLRGELRHGGGLVAEAEGLFVTLRDGQP